VSEEKPQIATPEIQEIDEMVAQNPHASDLATAAALPKDVRLDQRRWRRLRL
jgi:hypothetical protein